MKAQKLNYRQAHQTLYLLEFNLTLKYIPGIKIKIDISKDKKVVRIVEEIKKVRVKVLRRR